MTSKGEIFYKDQQSSGGSHLTEKVDEEFEKEKQAKVEEEMEIEEQFVLESTFINEKETEQVSQSSSFLTSSINRSRLARDTRQLIVKET